MPTAHVRSLNNESDISGMRPLDSVLGRREIVQSPRARINYHILRGNLIGNGGSWVYRHDGYYFRRKFYLGFLNNDIACLFVNSFTQLYTKFNFKILGWTGWLYFLLSFLKIQNYQHFRSKRKRMLIVSILL